MQDWSRVGSTEQAFQPCHANELDPDLKDSFSLYLFQFLNFLLSLPIRMAFCPYCSTVFCDVDTSPQGTGLSEEREEYLRRQAD